IGGEVFAAGLFVGAAARKDAAGGTEGEIERTFRRPLAHLRRSVKARPRRTPARDMEGLEETLGDGIGLAAGKAARTRRRVQALDRHRIGHAEAGEGVAHIAFADEAAQIRILRSERFYRLTLAA